MSHVMVRYRVKPGEGPRNEELVRRVYEELHVKAPVGLRYATFALEDGVSFVHLAEVAEEDGRNPLLDVTAFRDFTANIADRCDEPPALADLRVIGSFGNQSGREPHGAVMWLATRPQSALSRDHRALNDGPGTNDSRQGE